MRACFADACALLTRARALRLASQRSFAARDERALRLVTSAMALSPFCTQALCLALGWAATPHAIEHGLPRSEGDDMLLLVLQAVMRDGKGGCAPRTRHLVRPLPPLARGEVSQRRKPARGELAPCVWASAQTGFA